MPAVICPACGEGGSSRPNESIPSQGYRCHGKACKGLGTLMVPIEVARSLTITAHEASLLSHNAQVQRLLGDKPLVTLRNEPAFAWALARLLEADGSPESQERAILWRAETHRLEKCAHQSLLPEEKRSLFKRLGVTYAQPEDRESTQRLIKWCKKHKLSIGGFPFDDPIRGQDGVHLILLVPEGTPVVACEYALQSGRATRDVVSHETRVCPPSWFVGAGISLLPAAARPSLFDNEEPSPR